MLLKTTLALQGKSDLIEIYTLKLMTGEIHQQQSELKTQGPAFHLQNPHKKAGCCACICNPWGRWSQPASSSLSSQPNQTGEPQVQREVMPQNTAWSQGDGSVQEKHLPGKPNHQTSTSRAQVKCHGWERQLGASTALTEGQSSVPSTYVEWAHTTHNSTSRGHDTSNLHRHL